MNNISFSGHCGCGHSHGHGHHHHHNHGIYGTNMWNVNGNQPGNQPGCGHQQACNGCVDVIKGICVLYTGPNLTSTGINQNDDFNTVVSKLNAIKAIQDTKNTNILTALNDLNSRVNALELAVIPPIVGGGSHPPYTLI